MIIVINGTRIEQIYLVCYLVSMVTDDSICHAKEDIKGQRSILKQTRAPEEKAQSELKEQDGEKFCTECNNVWI